MSPTRLVSAMVLFCVVVGLRAADTYQIDAAHSAFLFKVKHMNVSYTHGRFNSSSGTIVLDDDASKCSVSIEIKAESVDTGNGGRDQHLKGPDFFNAKQFATLTYKSKAVKKTGNDYEVTGDFTMLGVTKDVTVKLAQIGAAGGKVGFEGTFTIKRSDYGMKKMLEGIGDDVEITVAVEAGKK